MNNAFEAILYYLLDHSEANDTLQGVMGWWLLDAYQKWSSAEVREALESAAGQSFVVEVRGADGQVRYRLNPGKLPEICKLLRSRLEHE